jgi:hypothetical protein
VAVAVAVEEVVVIFLNLEIGVRVRPMTPRRFIKFRDQSQ